MKNCGGVGDLGTCSRGAWGHGAVGQQGPCLVRTPLYRIMPGRGLQASAEPLVFTPRCWDRGEAARRRCCWCGARHGLPLCGCTGSPRHGLSTAALCQAALGGEKRAAAPWLQGFGAKNARLFIVLLLLTTLGGLALSDSIFALF